MGNDIKKHLLKSLKIAVAALLSIFIAGELGLAHSATAGIITVLSIGRTKRETFRSAVFVCVVAIVNGTSTSNSVIGNFPISIIAVRSGNAYLVCVVFLFSLFSLI